jgi:hypothetical protein
MTAGLENIGTPTILMVGPTGGGKSSLGNRFVRREVFRTSDDPTSETSKTVMEETQIQSGPNSMFLHRAIDSPGNGDSEGRDWFFMENNIKFLQNVEPGVNLVVIVVEMGSRAGTDFQLAFKMLHVAFGNRAELWDHTCLVLSKCYWYRRRYWESQVERHIQAWQEKIRAIGQYCTGDNCWNYELPVFIIDSDPELIPTAEDEQAIWEDPAVKLWWEDSKQSFGVLPFRGWKSVPIQDDRLHSMFDFMLFQEWARTRTIMTTKTLQIPSRQFF